MTDPPIIYFDQNYFSNMAKAKLKIIRNKNTSEKWMNFYQTIKKKVLSKKLICPVSEFHFKESSLDKVNGKQITILIHYLSQDIHINEWDRILGEQIKDAAYEFVNGKKKKRAKWSPAFEENPIATIKNREKISLRTVGEYWDDYYPFYNVNSIEQSKDNFYVESISLLEEYKKNTVSHHQLILESKKSTVDGYIGQHEKRRREDLAKSNSAIDQLNATYQNWEHAAFMLELENIGIKIDNPKELLKFGESNELLNSPFIEINGVIWAAVAEAYLQDRHPGKGDFYDAPILASTIPYCDIVATDSFMKGIITKYSPIDKKYNCKIFSASNKDIEELQDLISNL
jgi:hypothetical protein